MKTSTDSEVLCAAARQVEEIIKSRSWLLSLPIVPQILAGLIAFREEVIRARPSPVYNFVPDSELANVLPVQVFVPESTAFPDPDPVSGLTDACLIQGPALWQAVILHVASAKLANISPGPEMVPTCLPDSTNALPVPVPSCRSSSIPCS
ncbi:hypothetical protein EXN66_Car017070 [Channa argus]|uniref:Uncharacterized protein n=1 Tax=Channa argus TaxID=215402 RepID=A0A6G1QFQ3_CHAAH|nr:hypothetical protein EXN66_Car017070 [Channa argus]